MNITELFNNNELSQTNDGYKTICPDCGLQGGRTEGFKIFPETNTSYCHSSHKWFTLLQTAGLKLGVLKCIEGTDRGDKPQIDDEQKEEIFDLVKEEYDKEFVTEFRLACGDINEFLIETITKTGIVKRTVNVDRVASYIINKYDIQTIYGLKEETIYVYDDGIWKITGKGLIKSEIESLLKTWSNNNVVSEVVEKIKRKTETTREEFDLVPDFKICLINGVMDIEDINNLKFLPHSKEYNFKRRFPITYNPMARCPNIIKFLEQTFYPSDLPQVQESLGHHFPRKYIFKKANIIHGPKNTGKTVYLNLLTSFLGIENVADLSLQKVSSGKGFDLLVLKDKYGNIHDDLSSKDLDDGGGFKMCIGDGFICGEEKFGDHHRFRNTAKMTFACNKIPPVKDMDDDAYYDRFLVWMLDNIITKEEKNPNLIKELTTQEELSGLLNYALEGYIRLIKQNQFSNEKNSEEVKELMVSNGSPLARFVTDVLIEDAGNKINKEEMYNQYCHYCTSQKPKLSPCSKDQLGKQLSRFAPFILSSSNGRERYWLNVKINSLVNMTTITPFKKIYGEKKVGIKDDVCIPYMFLPDLSLLSDNTQPKKKRKVSKNSVKKKRTDREVQFWEAEECKDIVCECTEEEVLKHIKENPKQDYEVAHKKFGVGFYKHIKKLREKELIK